MKIVRPGNYKISSKLATTIIQRKPYPTQIESLLISNNILNLVSFWSEYGSTRFHSGISHIEKRIFSEDWFEIRPGIEAILKSQKGPPDIQKILMTA